MAIESAQIAVTGTATQLTSAVDTRTYGLIAVTNRGTAAVYLGTTGVTTATGFQVDVGQTVSLDVNTGAGDVLFGIAASGSHVCHILRAGR